MKLQAIVSRAIFGPLGVVPLAFGFLAMFYNQTTGEGDKIASTSIISGLEKRRQTAADRDVLLAAGQPRFVVAGVIDSWTASTPDSSEQNHHSYPASNYTASQQQRYGVQRHVEPASGTRRRRMADHQICSESPMLKLLLGTTRRFTAWPLASPWSVPTLLHVKPGGTTMLGRALDERQREVERSR